MEKDRVEKPKKEQYILRKSDKNDTLQRAYR